MFSLLSALPLLLVTFHHAPAYGQVSTDTNCDASDPKFDLYQTVYFRGEYPPAEVGHPCNYFMDPPSSMPPICQRFSLPMQPHCVSIKKCTVASFAQSIALPIPAENNCWQCWLYRESGCHGEALFTQHNVVFPDDFTYNFKSFLCGRYKCSDLGQAKAGKAHAYQVKTLAA